MHTDINDQELAAVNEHTHIKNVFIYFLQLNRTVSNLWDLPQFNFNLGGGDDGYEKLTGL